jgi:cell division transport system permease protein
MSNNASLAYALTDAARNIKENRLTIFFSSVTVAFSLSILALFLIIFANLNNVVEGWGDRTHIVAYVKDSSLKLGEDKLYKKMKSLKAVESVQYISKARAKDILKKALKGHEGVLDGVEGNPLPASFEIRLIPSERTPAGIAAVVKTFKSLDWVSDVQYGTEWVEKFSAFLSFLELVLLMIGVFLLAATLFIMSNTIRLTIYARRDEIEVLGLVGASVSYIKLPFFIEGMAAGFLGGLLSFFMLFSVRYILMLKVPVYFSFILVSPLSSYILLGVLLIIGTLIGGLGSLASLGRFLRA